MAENECAAAQLARVGKPVFVRSFFTDKNNVATSVERRGQDTAGHTDESH